MTVILEEAPKLNYAVFKSAPLSLITSSLSQKHIAFKLMHCTPGKILWLNLRTMGIFDALILLTSRQIEKKKTCCYARMHTHVHKLLALLSCTRTGWWERNCIPCGSPEDSSETQIKALTWLAFCQQEGVLPPQPPHPIPPPFSLQRLTCWLAGYGQQLKLHMSTYDRPTQPYRTTKRKHYNSQQP